MEEKPKYFVLLTDAGARLEARAVAEKKALVLTHIAVGDENLAEVEPKPEAERLVREVYRAKIESRSISEEDPNVVLLHGLIPASAGGFWIREIGVAGRLEGDEADVLYAYGNHAPYYKMLPQDGQTVTHELTIPIVQSSACSLRIEVSEQGYATRRELEELRAQMAPEALARLSAGILRLENRLAQMELGHIGGCSGFSAGQARLSPAGYLLGGATVAPVTIVPEGGQAPPDAAFVVKMETTPSNP